MKQSRAWILALGLCVSHCLPATDSPLANAEIGRPQVRNFAPRDYGSLPQNFAVAQDPRGVAYFGGTSGVLEYDGVHWRLLHTARGTGVRSLARHSDGLIYVGGQAEFGVLEPGSDGALQYRALDQDLPPESRDFADVWWTWSADRGVYFQSQARLFLHAGGQLQSWGRPNSMRRSFLVGQRLLINDAELGLVELVQDQFRPLPYSETLVSARLIAALAADPAQQGERILFVTDRAGLFVAEGDELRPLDSPSTAELTQTPLYNAARLNDSLFALTSLSSGVRIVDLQGQLLRRIGRAEGLRSEQVLAVAPDAAGDLWLALGNGIAHVSALSPLSRFGEAEGVAALVTNLARFEGRLYAGSMAGLLQLQRDPARFEPVSAASQVPVWATLPVSEGLLVGQDSGLYLLDSSGQFELLAEIRPVMALHQDRLDPDRVWIGRNIGLSSLRRNASGGWQLESDAVRTTSFVRSLAQDDAGALWLGTEQDGVLRLQVAPGPIHGPLPAEQIRHYGLEDGLPDVNRTGVATVDGEVLVQLALSTLRYLPTEDRFVADARIEAAMPEGCWADRILAKGADGGLWLACSAQQGVQRIGSLQRQTDGRWRWEDADLRPLHSAGLYAVHVDPDGVVWLSIDDGLVRYDPRIGHDPRQPYNALVRRVAHVDGPAHYLGSMPAAGLAPPSWDYTDRALRFEYAATAFAGPEHTRYQVWLEGQDPNWSDWTHESYRDYTNLREGNYRFHVRARNQYGTLSSEDRYDFSVLPPWQRTLPARWAGGIALATLAVLIGWLVARARTRRVLAANARLDQLVQARTRELTEANDALRQSQQALQQSGRRAELIYKALNEALVGETVDDKYRLEERLGAGGFGTVYRARHLQLNTAVALKILKPVTGQDREHALQRFRDEGVAAFRVHHPNAVAVLDFAIWMDAIAYLVMDLVDGPSLEELLRRRRRFPSGRVAALLAPICDVLAAAHAAGVVHRDVKPANILLDRRDGQEQPRLIDFGIAKLRQPGGGEGPTPTGTGMVVGTPGYMAPERVLGQPYDGRSDVYSMAVIAYEMLTGVRPHFHRSDTVDSDEPSRGLRPIGSPPVPLQTLAAGQDFPTQLAQLIEQALSVDPGQRPDAATMATIFWQIARQYPVPADEWDDEGPSPPDPSPYDVTTPLPR